MKKSMNLDSLVALRELVDNLIEEEKEKKQYNIPRISVIDARKNSVGILSTALCLNSLSLNLSSPDQFLYPNLSSLVFDLLREWNKMTGETLYITHSLDCPSNFVYNHEGKKVCKVKDLVD